MKSTWKGLTYIDHKNFCDCLESVVARWDLRSLALNVDEVMKKSERHDGLYHSILSAMQSFHGGAKGYTRKRQHVERAAAGTITNNLPILHQDSSIEYWQKMLQFSFLSFLPTITFAHCRFIYHSYNLLIVVITSVACSPPT